MANIIGRRVNVADMAFPSGGSGMRPVRPGVAPVEDSGGLSKVFSALAAPYLDGVGTQLKQSQIDLLEQKIAGERMQNEGRQGVSDAFGADGPIDMRAIYGAAARGGVTDVSNLLRGFTANTQGATAPATTNAFVGAGGSYGSTAAGFRESESNDTAQLLAAADRQAAAQRARDEAEFPRRIALADRESASRASLADATLVEVNTPNGPVYQRRSDAVGQAPLLTQTQVEGSILSRLGADDQRSVALGTSSVKPVEYIDPITLLPKVGRPDQAVGNAPVLSTDQVRAGVVQQRLPTATPDQLDRLAFGDVSQGTLYNYRTSDGRTGVTRDARVDGEGNPLPQQGLQVWKTTTPEVQTSGPANNKLYDTRIATRTAMSGIDGLITQLGKPDADAAVGWLGTGARFLNDLRAQTEAASRVLGGKSLSEEMNTDPGLATAATQAIANHPELLNRARALGVDAAVIQSRVTDLAYMIAKAQDPSGRTSGPDFENAARTVGSALQDPKSGVAVLQDLKARIANSQSIREGVHQEMFGGPGAPPAAPPAAPGAPPATGVRRMFNPATGMIE